MAYVCGVCVHGGGEVMTGESELSQVKENECSRGRHAGRGEASLHVGSGSMLPVLGDLKIQSFS